MQHPQQIQAQLVMGIQHQQPRIVNGRPVGRKPFNAHFDRTKTFPEKLWAAVNDKQSGIISWSKDGKSIIVEDKLFVGEVMKFHPGLVQIASFTNFRRQLREYGFDWYINNTCEFEFSHPCFTRGRPELLRELQSRRKCQATGMVPKGDGTRGVRRNSVTSFRDSFRGAKKSQSDNSVNKATQVPVFFSPFAQPAAPTMVPLALWQQANLQNTRPVSAGGGDASFNVPPNTQNTGLINGMADEAVMKSAERSLSTPSHGHADGDHQLVKTDAALCHQPPPPPPPPRPQQYCQLGQYSCNMSTPLWFPSTMGPVGMYNPNCWYTGAPPPPPPCYGPHHGPASVAYAGAMIPPQDAVSSMQTGEPHPGLRAPTEQPSEGGATSHANLVNVAPERFPYNGPAAARETPSAVLQTPVMDTTGAIPKPWKNTEETDKLWEKNTEETDKPWEKNAEETTKLWDKNAEESPSKDLKRKGFFNLEANNNICSMSNSP